MVVWNICWIQMCVSIFSGIQVTHNIKHLARIPQIQIEDWEE